MNRPMGEELGAGVMAERDCVDGFRTRPERPIPRCSYPCLRSRDPRLRGEWFEDRRLLRQRHLPPPSTPWRSRRRASEGRRAQRGAERVLAGDTVTGRQHARGDLGDLTGLEDIGDPEPRATATGSVPRPVWPGRMPVSPKWPLSSTTTVRFAGRAAATVPSAPMPISCSPSPVRAVTGWSGRGERESGAARAATSLPANRPRRCSPHSGSDAPSSRRAGGEARLVGYAHAGDGITDSNAGAAPSRIRVQGSA
ncbi:hypothetical protein SAMN04488000_12451 [Lentzea albida]|uniref:Uncharacterized protein n=1 Tax=Lentzea albida TaxID=65499 RepID=A0A1H9WRV7_9PSEU|nr:hypothetical protein SAMN04488000_12451 [Lentzea albida]